MQDTTLNNSQTLLSKRLTEGYKANKKFYEGDHWQDGEGYPALPPMGVDNREQIIEKIKKGFTAENQIGAIVETHLDGAIAREPDWDLVDTTAKQSDSPDQTGAEKAEDKIRNEAISALIEWWNSRRMIETLREALALTLIQEKCVIRAFVPPGFLDDDGNIKKQTSLGEALKMIQFEVLTADQAAVFRDKERYEPYGVFVKTHLNGSKKVELTFLDKDGNTRLRVLEQGSLFEFAQKTLPQIAAYMSPSDGVAPPQEIEPINLNGNLLMFELSRKPLIDEQMRSMQRHLNLTWTMSGRNTVIAGTRERYFLNTEKPKKPVITQGTDGSQVKTYAKTSLKIGGEASNFLAGNPIYEGTGQQRKIVGYASANVVVVEPVDTKNFHEQRDKIVFAMRSAAHQSHIQMNDMASVSGVSKQEGRAGFDKSLKRSKGTIDPAGRWIIEVALRFAAAHTTGGNGKATREKEFEKYRIDFNAIVDAGAIDLEQTKDDKADVEDGLMSPETYLSRRGIEDPEAEMKRLEQSEFFKLARKKKQLEVAILAKQAGFPNEEILVIVGYNEEEQKRLLPLMTNEIGSEN
jgi:hypothetical protein